MTASVRVGLFPPPDYEIPFEPFDAIHLTARPEQVAEFVSPPSNLGPGQMVLDGRPFRRPFIDTCDPRVPFRPPSGESKVPTEHVAAKRGVNTSVALSPLAPALADVAFPRAAPDDGPAIEAMLARCSEKSLSDRFFRPLSKAPDGYLDQVLSNRDVHFVFLVQRHGEVIGWPTASNRISMWGHGTHSGAAYHDRGIGTASLGLLIEVARPSGRPYALNADVRIQNGVALRALQRTGKATVIRAWDICHVQVHIGSLKGECCSVDAPFGGAV